MVIEQIIEIPANRKVFFELPLELPIGKAKVELIITPEKQKIFGDEKSAFGCLSRFANPAKIPGEKGAWARAILAKYEKS